MNEQLQDESTKTPVEVPDVDLRISEDGQIEQLNNVIDLTGNNPASSNVPIQPEAQPYSYGSDAGDRKIGENINDRILQLKAQGNHPNANE